jgi:acid phosphatase
MTARLIAPLCVLLVIGFSCLHNLAVPVAEIPPQYDHVVVVIEENHSFDQLTDEFANDAPYFNQTLVPEGASFTRAYGEEHRSQGNYLWLFAGSNFESGFTNIVPIGPFEKPNLATTLDNAGLSFAIYSEGLPELGSTVTDANGYARRHNPVVNFSNVSAEANRPWSDFPSDFSLLPTVSFVVPDVFNDMHDGTDGDRIAVGDTWLREHLDSYYEWAKMHNSLLIVTWDEDNGAGEHLTDPALGENHIATVFAGDRVVQGEYNEPINHVNMLRTIEAMYDLPYSGSQTPVATLAGLSNEPILGVFR